MTVSITKETKNMVASTSPVTLRLKGAGTHLITFPIEIGTYTAEQFGTLVAGISVVAKFVNGSWSSHIVGVPPNNFTIDATCNNSIYITTAGDVDITFAVEIGMTLGARYISPTWDESTMTWDENTESWGQQGTIWAKETKNVATLTLETK